MSCARLFEVEADRDGRLSGVERASYERHLETCAECSAERDVLADLAARARTRTEAPDDLRARRGARQLLGTFNRTLTEPEPSRLAARAGLLVPALALVVVLVGYRFLSPAAPAPVATAEPVPSSALPDRTKSAGRPSEPFAASDSAPPPAPPRPLPPDPAAEYRAAVAKLQGGDDRAAAAAFERFAKKYPTHENAEDAAYLRVVAFDHAGDRPATEAAGTDYLTAHPNGFRRPEVEKLLRR